MKNDDSPSARAGVWDRVLAAAAATVALWAVLVSVLAGEVLPFAVGLGVLYGVLAAATLLWPGRVVYWVAIVVSIATLAGWGAVRGVRPGPPGVCTRLRAGATP